MPKKKQVPSVKKRVMILALLAILIFSSLLAIVNLQGGNSIPPPSPSSFKETIWMQFLPADVEGFRFINISSLVGIPNLFQSSVILNLTQLGMNITTNDVLYGIDMKTSSGIIVNVMVMNESMLSQISLAFQNSTLIPFDHGNKTIFYFNVSPLSDDEHAWAAIDKGSLMIAEGDDRALTAMRSVLDANSTTFFDTDQEKVAYILTSDGKNNFIFSYYASGNNTYNVDWEMRAAYNSTLLGVRTSFHFKNLTYLNSNYNTFKTNILADANRVLTSDVFIIGDFSYPQSMIREVLMGV